MAAGRRALGVIAVFVLAPILAVVLITTLLLLGVNAHWVFLPGFFVKSHFHVPNAVGVLTTGFVWWAIIVVVWLTLRQLLRRSA